MGKSQKKRAAKRHNPVRVPDSHIAPGLAAAQSAAPAEKAAAVLPIIQKLNSHDAAERAWACAAVSNLIQNDPGTRRLLQGKNVVGTLITRLSDSVEEVVVEATGALRNLCIDGGHEICGEMYNKNILSPLKTCVSKMSTTLDRMLSDVKPELAEIISRKLVYEFAENVITIFWCLSETSNKALNAINALDLTPFLMAFLVSRARIPIGTVVAAAQCLYILTDDNEPCIDSVRSSGTWVNTFMDLAKPTEANGVNGVNGVNGMNGVNGKVKGSHKKDEFAAEDPEKALALKVLSCGILRNIAPLPSLLPASSIDIDQVVVLPSIVPLLDISLPDTTARAIELQKGIEYKPLSAKGPKVDHKSREEKELEALEARLRTLQLSLELLTGVCAVIPEDEQLEAEPVPQQNEMEEDDDDQMSPTDEEALDHEEDQPSSIPAPPLPSVLQTLIALPSRILPLIPATILSYSSPSPVPPISSALRLVHLRALEALGNLLLGAAAFGVPIEVRDQVWNVVWQVVESCDVEIQDGGKPGSDVKEAAVNVLWTCLEGAGESAMDVVKDAPAKLISICESSQDVATKSKCVASLAKLGQRRDPRFTSEHQTISAYLFHPFSPPFASLPTPLALSHMHAIIDMFSDETSPCDVVFEQNGYLGVMEGAKPWLSKEIRKWRGRERDEGRELVKEWGRFCQWRRSLPQGMQDVAMGE